MIVFKLSVLLFVLTLFVLSADCWFWERTEGIFNRTKRQNKCNDDHECGSGECISEDNVCDGIAHCQDGSDETDSCKNIRCQSYLFRCAYGACINPEYECDGKQDCRDNSDETSPKCRRTSPRPNLCPSGQFSCNNGDCIDEFDQCDGIRNCADGSDETVEHCGDIKCQKFTFRCNYGACIESSLKCNGRQDCADNSDELNCPGGTGTTTTTTTTTTTSRTPTQSNINGGCILPTFPANGKWTVYGGNNNRPGQVVSETTIIIVTCNTGYKLYPENGLTSCLNGGKWSETHKCLRTCATIDKTEKLIPTCVFNGSITSCENPYEGTTATLKCAPFYEDPGLKYKPQRLCHDGSWNSALPNCEPVCGLSTQKAEKLIINGENATKGDYPWQVGVYMADNFEHICGASIITAKITLSAAHCFELDDEKRYLVAAGKYFRTYNHPEDKFAQYAKLSKIIKHPDYNSLDNENNDIAILVLEKPFKIGSYVLPVCYDSSESFDYSNLNGKTGVVVGWGFTDERGSPSETLKQLSVEYKSESQCDLNKDFKFYYRPYAQDKLCAGLLFQGKSACKGDSGGGLIFRDDDDRYFIRGIVSVAPQRLGGGCNSSQLSLYTGVSYHVNMIFQQISINPV